MNRDAEHWDAQALCAQVVGDQFFPSQGDSITANAAKRLCEGCPVKVECLTDALVKDEVFGVRGGYTAHERRQLRKGAA